MYILDKNKDYYDYVSGIYGVDKTITYDRRGSILIDEKELLDSFNLMHMNTYFFDEKKVIFFILEIGYVQYLFKYSDFDLKKVNGALGMIKYKLNSYKCELVHTYKNNKHYFEKEISLVRYHPAYHYNWKRRKSEEFFAYDYEDFSQGKVDIEKIIPNPILRGTTVTTYILAEDIWKELSNYISAKGNDKIVEIVNSDIQKLENHGFDKKVSFRNPIKL